MSSDKFFDREYDDNRRGFHDFASQQAAWSQATFGLDSVRGPLGPLKHLAKEAVEAQEKPDDVTEYADCLFLTLDAARRAGFDSHALLEAAYSKLEVNKAREWPKVTDVNAAVEHKRKDPTANGGDGSQEQEPKRGEVVVLDCHLKAAEEIIGHKAHYIARIIAKYCPDHAAKVSELERERDGWKFSAEQFLRNQQFYHGLICQIGETFGVAAKTSDDGSAQDDVLALKVPELVADLRKQLAAEREKRERLREAVQLTLADAYFGATAERILRKALADDTGGE